MEPFDYYVSGAKIGRQVPRFEAPLVSLKGHHHFSVNDALNEGAFILIFGDLDPTTFKSEIPIYHVVREEVKKIKPNLFPVIADTSLEIAESFGVLNEKTGLFIPSIFGIKASGQLGFKLEGLDLKALDQSLFKTLIKSLNR